MLVVSFLARRSGLGRLAIAGIELVLCLSNHYGNRELLTLCIGSRHRFNDRGHGLSSIQGISIARKDLSQR